MHFHAGLVEYSSRLKAQGGRRRVEEWGIEHRARGLTVPNCSKTGTLCTMRYALCGMALSPEPGV
jgi:hypothetical protein